MAGSCATKIREPSQGRKAAALNDIFCAPQIAWSSLQRPDALLLRLVCNRSLANRLIIMSFDLDVLRIFLHVLAVTVWVGGQIVMAAMMPAIRGIESGDTRRAFPQAFQRVAWPAFGLAVFTGIWNILAIDMAAQTDSWNMAFGFKFLLVLISGGAAFYHSRTANPKLKGATAGIALLSALVAMFLGFGMTH